MKQFTDAGSIIKGKGKAEGRADRDHGRLHLNACCHALEDIFNDPFDCRLMRSIQDSCKLIPAKSRCRDDTVRFGQTLANLMQDLIADGVAKLVIERFETIKINKQNRDCLLYTSDAADD